MDLKRTKQPVFDGIDIDIADEPLVLSKGLLDLLLTQDNYSELLALYCFYYYTAKWQKTNQIRSTTSYTSKGMKWSETKTKQTKKCLRDLGLIEDIVSKNPETHTITGHYIRIRFLWGKDATERLIKKEPTKSAPSKPPDRKPTQWENQPTHKTYEKVNNSTTRPKTHPLGNRPLNSLSTNRINALSTNRGGKKNFAPLRPPTKTLPSRPSMEKRVGDRSIRYFPPTLVKDPLFQKSWKEWLDYRRSIGYPIESEYKQHFKRIVSSTLKEVGSTTDILVRSIKQSINRNWRGLFPPRDGGGGNRNGSSPPRNSLCVSLEESLQYAGADIVEHVSIIRE